MISDRIKLLFIFIEFLHSNSDNFKQYNGVITELHKLNAERCRLNPNSSFSERMREDEINAEIKRKIDVIEENIVIPIKSKATALNIFDSDNDKTIWSNNYGDIVELKQNAERSDLAEILQSTEKYLAFRITGNHTDYLVMGLIFKDLDKLIIEEIHNYFSSNKAAITSGTQANTLHEALGLLREGHTTITIPFAHQSTLEPQQANSLISQSEPMTDDQAPITPPPRMDVGEGQIQPYLPAIKEIEDELRNRSTIREKLDYWVEAISKRVEEVSGQRHDLDSLTTLDDEQKSILKNVFGGTARLVSPIRIPEYIHLEHFPDWQSNAAYTNWFIPIKSKFWFNKLVEDKNAEEHINSALGIGFIHGQLNPITDIEHEAEKLLASGKINVDIDYKDQSNRDMVEYLRIKGGYYERNASPGIFPISGTNPQLQAYARHVSYKEYLLRRLSEIQHSENEALPPQPSAEQKTDSAVRLIIFNSTKTINNLHNELKGYFPGKEAELLKALHGESIAMTLLFPHNQNKFVEIFRRVKYNNLLTNSSTEIKDWICSTFQRKKKGETEPQPFNKDTVWSLLSAGRGEPKKGERICVVDWLPYKSPTQLASEAEKEKR